jgi:hypothetical protein
MNILTGRAEVQKWYRKPLDGCISSNGKPYNISLKVGTVNKLLVLFIGGGGSWNEHTAANPITVWSQLIKKESFYISDISPMILRLMHVGILNANDKRNPFYDWNILTIPYTTADFHIGNNEYPYKDVKGKDKVLYHHGIKNVTAALEVLKEFFCVTPDMLVIAGLSAGAFGCVAHCPHIVNLYPDCNNVVVYSESSHIHSSLWSDITRNVWKVSSELTPYIKSEDLIVDLFCYAQDNMPSHTLFLHANSLWDIDLVKFMNKMNHGRHSVDSQALQEYHNTLIHAVKKLKNKITNYSYYLTDYGKNHKDGTTPHTFSGTPKILYSKMQNGMSIADWLIQALDKTPLDIGEEFIL